MDRSGDGRALPERGDRAARGREPDGARADVAAIGPQRQAACAGDGAHLQLRMAAFGAQGQGLAGAVHLAGEKAHGAVAAGAQRQDLGRVGQGDGAAGLHLLVLLACRRVDLAQHHRLSGVQAVLAIGDRCRGPLDRVASLLHQHVTRATRRR